MFDRNKVFEYMFRLWEVKLNEESRLLGYGEVPTFSRQSARIWRHGYQPYAPAALYPQEGFWYSFLLDAESTPGP
jgi:hypothetical protein